MNLNTTTLKKLLAEHTALGEKIAVLQAQAEAKGVTISIAEAHIDLRPGEHYAGLIIGDHGAPAHHLVLMEGEVEDITWNDAMAWAKERGGELPTRREQALLFANCKAQFKPEWYWSSEPHETEGSYAWIQSFVNGYQHYLLKSFDGRARAVRRVAG